MKTLKGKKIQLRAMEPKDIDFLFQIENDTTIWNVSNTNTPYSRYYLEQYIINSHNDIYSEKQLRLIIEADKKKPVGAIDLFEFDPKHLRAGIGILIIAEERKKGYASETLDVLINYCKNNLFLNQLFCNIEADNKNSLKLFKDKGFEITGTKRNWIRTEVGFKDELFLQLFFK
ncbi:MAG: GNAT family N-acetyltransferase [Bacteroidetes bacterium]|nr:GNAT family N-acetyltransferase [Bacteroidota bacterium]